MEFGVKLQEILNRIMQEIISIITTALVSAGVNESM